MRTHKKGLLSGIIRGKRVRRGTVAHLADGTQVEVIGALRGRIVVEANWRTSSLPCGTFGKVIVIGSRPSNNCQLQYSVR